MRDIAGLKADAREPLWSAAQRRQIPKKRQRLRIGERLGVLDGTAVHDVAHSEFGDLAGFGAWNVGDLYNLRRHVARAGARFEFSS